MSCYNLTSMLYVLVFILCMYLLIDFSIKRYNQLKRIKKFTSDLYSKNIKKVHVKIKHEYGIAIPLCDSDTTNKCILLIKTLKKIGCKLPFFVTAPKTINLARISVFSNVITRNIDCIPSLLRVNTILEAPFAHVLVVSPNILFLHNPDYILYQNTGLLLWKNMDASNPLLESIHPDNIPSTFSDVMCINKKACNRWLFKLTVCKDYWDILGTDELLYSFLAQICKQNYTCTQNLPNAIGKPQFENGICGNLLFSDLDNIPFFMTNTIDLKDCTHVSVCNGGAKWVCIFYKVCLQNGGIVPISSVLAQILSDYAKIYTEIIKNNCSD